MGETPWWNGWLVEQGDYESQTWESKLGRRGNAIFGHASRRYTIRVAGPTVGTHAPNLRSFSSIAALVSGQQESLLYTRMVA